MVTLHQNHQIIPILMSLQYYYYFFIFYFKEHQIQKFSSNLNLRKQDFLSQEKIRCIDRVPYFKTVGRLLIYI